MRIPMLRAQFSHALAAEAGKWNLLFPRGMWHGANLAPIGGSIDLDSGLLDEMVANWASAGKPKLPVRKTHRHLDSDVPAKDRLELEKSFGWLTDLRVTAQGLEALTEWTPAGKASVDGGEFAFWSPEWQPRHRDRRTGEVKGWWLSGTALTNDPFFNEMPPVAASADDAEEKSTDPTHKEQHMTKEQLEALRASLGLAADATVEQILKASSALVSERDALKAEATKLKASAPTAEVITAAVAPMKAQLDELVKENETLKAERLTEQTEALITTAKGEGKAAEPMREFIVAAAKRSIDEAKRLVAALPVAMSTQEKGISGGEVDEAKLQAAASKEYFEKLDAFAKASGQPIATATRVFNRDNAELAKRAFTTR